MGQNESQKFRSRGYYENEEEMNREDAEHSRIRDEDDVGPMSLTINTQQFHESYNPPKENSETQQFTIDEERANETVKQE